VVPVLVALVLTASVPLLGALCLFARPALLGVLALVALAAVLRLMAGPRARGWWARAISPVSEYRGLRITRQAAMDAGHCWASLEGENAVVGVDDLVASALGPVEEVGLPYVGRRVARGEPLVRLRRGSRTVDLPSPLSGTIVARNESLNDHPELINEKPFVEGWVARIRAERLSEERPSLMIGRRAVRWFRREVDMLLRLLATPGPAGSRLDLRIDDASWELVRRAFATTAPRD
jgi:glycine cleavage system H protein